MVEYNLESKIFVAQDGSGIAEMTACACGTMDDGITDQRDAAEDDNYIVVRAPLLFLAENSAQQ